MPGLGGGGAGRDHGGRKMKRLITWSREGMQVGGAGVCIVPCKVVRGQLWSQAGLVESPQVFLRVPAPEWVYFLLHKLVVNSHPPLRGL